MYRSLILKELRELWWMAAIALVVMSGCVLWQMGLGYCLTCGGLHWKQNVEVPPWYLHPLPFFSQELLLQLALIGSGLAIALGAWQTWGESIRGTWGFLLHRPVRRGTVIWVKVGVGLTLVLGSTGLPLLFYGLWAATPGTHANPFGWWMMAAIWRMWLATILLYLGIYLCGIREARWFGSRLWPLVPMALIVYVVLTFAFWALPTEPGVIATSLMVGSVLLLFAAIPYAVRTRDFA